MAYSKVNKGFLVEAYLLDNKTSKSYNISDSIRNILVRKRFLAERYPLFVIEAIFKKDVYEAVVENNDISVSLRISSFNIGELNNTTDDISNEIGADEEIIDTTIRIYQSDFLDYQNIKLETDNSEESDVEVGFYRLSGVPDDIINGNNSVINNIYNNCKLVDIAINLLSQVGVYDIYIEPVSNNVIYKNILIPPLNVVPALYFLHKNYSFYDKSMSIFFDSKKAYMYSPLSTRDGSIIEYNGISKENTANSDIISGIEYDPEKNNLRVSSYNTINFIDKSSLNRNSLGSETIFYTYDDSFDLRKKIIENTAVYDKTRYFWNSSSEALHEKEMQSLKLSDIEIELNLPNINPEFITPITEVLVNNDSESDGRYAIEEVSYILTSSDDKYFTSNLKLTAIKK